MRFLIIETKRSAADLKIEVYSIFTETEKGELWNFVDSYDSLLEVW